MTAASAPAFPPGTRFRHPLHGVCTVLRCTDKALRYTYPSLVAPYLLRPSFAGHYATTTPQALAAVIGAGIIDLLED